MAWTLQPRSYMQAIRPNFYNLAYRRTGAYKGMGRLGQTDMGPSSTGGYVTGGMCPGDPSCPGYVDPYQNLSWLMEGVLAGQNVIVSTGAYGQQTRAGVTQPPPSTLYKWLPLIIGAGFVVLLLTTGSGRR